MALKIPSRRFSWEATLFAGRSLLAQREGRRRRGGARPND